MRSETRSLQSHWLSRKLAYSTISERPVTLRSAMHLQTLKLSYRWNFKLVSANWRSRRRRDHCSLGWTHVNWVTNLMQGVMAQPIIWTYRFKFSSMVTRSVHTQFLCRRPSRDSLYKTTPCTHWENNLASCSINRPAKFTIRQARHQSLLPNGTSTR